MIRDLIPGIKVYGGCAPGTGYGYIENFGRGYGFHFSVGKFQGDGSGTGLALNEKIFYSGRDRAGVVFAELDERTWIWLYNEDL